MSNANTSSSSTVTSPYPVGAVVAYAGRATSGQSLRGWYFCDGTAQSDGSGNQTAPLYRVLGTAYGSGSDGEFCLPDYRGQFLRGCDDGTGRDPDAALRTQPRPDLSVHGNQAPYVGSLQLSAMVSHTHTFSDSSGSQSSPAQEVVIGQYDVANATAQSRESGVNGGLEARPINQSVDYLVLADDTAPGAPAGVVMAYAGSISGLTGADWLPCDGRSLATASQSALSGCVGTLYGSSYESDFCIPCYRGLFLRGDDGGTGRDPNVSTRAAPRPDLPDPGASQGVGSVQFHDFPSHQHGYSGWTTDHSLTEDSGVGVRLNTLYGTMFDNGGGTATETRPDNIALDHIVAANDAAQPPSGAVIAYAGDIHDDDITIVGWLPCDGRLLDADDYPTLSAAIGTAHGGNETQFNVPDLRGRFVRGVYDDGGSIDPGPREAAATGGAVSGIGSFQGNALCNHEHTMQLQTSTIGVYTGLSTSLSSGFATRTSSGTTIAPMSTGASPAATLSRENRPRNTYVYYLIKT